MNLHIEPRYKPRLYGQTLINTILGKHSDQILNFINFKVDAKDQNHLLTLKNELESTDGIYCFWNEEFKAKYDDYISIIEKWLQRFEAKPFIIIADESEIEEKVKNQYRVISKESAENSLSILLSRSISRTKRFIRDVKTWKLVFFCTSFVLLSLLVCSLIFLNGKGNDIGSKITYDELPYLQSRLLFEKLNKINGNSEIPIQEIRGYLDEYIDLKQKQLRKMLDDESIEISLWRSNIANDSIFRKTRSNSPTNELPMVSVAGCACTANQSSDSYIVGWQSGDDKDVKHFWGSQNGLEKEFKDSKGNCKYLGKDNDKESIISVAVKLVPSARFNVICIDSENKRDMVVNKYSNEIVKSVIVELANLTSIIPNEVFDGTSVKQKIAPTGKTINK